MDANEVEERLYIGSMHPAFDHEWLLSKNITAVLQATDEASCIPKHPDITYFAAPIADFGGVRLEHRLSEPLNFIHSHLLRGETVLVHCSSGVSRSTTFVAAYLMAKYDKPFDEVLAWIRQCRPKASPNPSFQDQLRSLNLQGILK